VLFTFVLCAAAVKVVVKRKTTKEKTSNKK